MFLNFMKKEEDGSETGDLSAELGRSDKKRAFLLQDFALLLIDIDDFKRINDSYGHPVGDSMLAAVATKCRQSIRGEDFLARRWENFAGSASYPAGVRIAGAFSARFPAG
jgi:hypothetical protein